MRRCSFLLSLMFPLCGFFLMILTSCENFLNGGETARQIQEAIEIANSDPTTIYIEAEKDSGTVTPPQVKVKKKESFDLSFNPADDWKFIAWEVLDRTSGEVLDDVIKFDDASKLSVTGTLLKPTENLLIRPKSLRLPSIVSVTPAFPEISYSNAAITVTFNMPMEPEYITQDSSLFRYGPQNISITCGSDDVKEYFEVPEFNTSKTTLTLTPKSSKLSSFIQSLNKPFADIQISFGENIALVKDGVTLTLAQNKRNLFVRYKDDIETTPPTKYEFYATNDLESGNHFTQAALSVFGDSEILKNSTDGKIYIYGRYYDADSGVQSVKLTEKHTNAKDGSLAPVTYEPEYFTARNADFTDDGNGTTTFCIEYDLKSDDGAVLITLAVSDACGNPAEEQSFTAIKDSGLDLSGVELWNFKPSSSSPKFFTDDGTETGNAIQYYDWSSFIKNVKIDAVKKQVYKDCYVSENNLKEVSITYNSAVHKMNYNADSQIWNYIISDVSDISGLCLTLTIEDDYGHRATKNFSFPDVPSLINIGCVNTYSDTYNAFFQTFSEVTNIISVYDRTDSSEQTTRRYNVSDENSLSITMTGNNNEYSDYIYSDYRFFFINDYLAGNITQPISVNDAKSVNSNLSPVVIKEASIVPSDDGEFLILNVEIDATQRNPWNDYDSIIVQHCLMTQNITTFVFSKNSLKEQFYLSFTNRRYVNPNGVKLIGVTSEDISPDAEYDGEKFPKEWYFLGTPSENPDVYEKRKPTIFNGDIGYKSISAVYETDSLTVPDRYDYIIPSLVTDSESGIKKITVDTNGSLWSYTENEFLYDDEITWLWAEGEYLSLFGTYVIPHVWDVDKELNSLTIKYYDAYNNCSEWSGNVVSIKVPSFSIKNGTTNTFVSKGSDVQLYQWHLGVAKLDSSTNKWSKHSELSTVPVESTDENGRKIYTYSSVTLPSNQFVKVVGTASLENDLRCTNFGNSAPLYFYTGSTKNSRDYDYILNNGSSKSTVLVASDAPTFVHTLVTKRSLSECQDWTVDEWEHNHKHIGDKYMDFSTNPTAKKYSIPVGLMDSGDCYVVIAHFADGTCTMSSVMQK